MNGSEYQKHVMRTANKNLTKYEALNNCCLGMAGEVGEFIELIKKFKYHGKSLDLDKAKKELGDCIFYLVWAMDCLGLTMEEVLLANVQKLQKRYPEGFSTTASLNRPEE